MTKLLTILLISTFLFTQNLFSKEANPVVYAALGDTIYNNASKIEDLQNLKEFQVYKDEIIKYIEEIKSVKTIGFSIENGDSTVSKGDYLKKLRKLSKTNDFYVKTVNSNFKFSVKNNDNELFVNSVDSGLVDIDRFGEDIKKYYLAHEDEIDEYGTVLGNLVSTYGRKNKNKKIRKTLTKKEIQEAKMQRIRQKDKEKQEAIQDALEAELIRKKEKIRKNKKRELESTAK